MKPAAANFAQNFNVIRIKWLSEKANLRRCLTYHQGFITMNGDHLISVLLNCLSERYYSKHIRPDVEGYIDLFLKEIEPALEMLIRECGMDGYIFTISFSGHGVSATRFVRIYLEQ